MPYFSVVLNLGNIQRTFVRLMIPKLARLELELFTKPSILNFMRLKIVKLMYVIILSNMTLRASRRSAWIAGFLFGAVTLDTLFVHDLFGFQLPSLLKFIQGLRFLWKYSMTYVAVAQSRLMSLVWEGHDTPRPTIDLHFRCTLIPKRKSNG